MITDALLSFVPIGSPLSVAAVVSDIASTNTIDLAGTGVGQSPGNIIGNASIFGEDVGIGGVKPQVNVTMGTALVSAGGGTLQVKFQASADTAVTFQPASWKTLVETPALTVAQCTLNTVIARFDFPPAFPANLSPRFLRLLFSIATATTTAGTISSAIVTMVRDDQANRFAAGNFVVA